MALCERLGDELGRREGGGVSLERVSLDHKIALEMPAREILFSPSNSSPIPSLTFAKSPQNQTTPYAEE